jgi:hypothetical protein
MNHPALGGCMVIGMMMDIQKQVFHIGRQYTQLNGIWQVPICYAEWWKEWIKIVR